MNWTVENVEKLGFVRITTAGVFSAADHRKMVEDIVSHDFWQPGMNTLFDHTKLTFGKTDIPIMREAGENHVNSDPRIGDGKAAILVKSIADYGRSRQFQLLTDGRISAKLHIFMDENDAIKWLVE